MTVHNYGRAPHVSAPADRPPCPVCPPNGPADPPPLSTTVAPMPPTTRRLHQPTPTGPGRLPTMIRAEEAVLGDRVVVAGLVRTCAGGRLEPASSRIRLDFDDATGWTFARDDLLLLLWRDPS